MKHDMFGDIVESSVSVGSRQRYSVPLSILTHAVLVAVLVVAPLTMTSAFPTPQSVLAFAIPPPAPTPVPPPEIPAMTAPPPVVTVNPAAAPLVEPTRVSAEPLVPPVYVPAPTVPVSTGPPAVAVAAAPVALAAPPPSKPIPVGGAVQEPRRLHYVNPVFPAVARAARREGMVILEATIGKDGRVSNARVLRSDVMFDRAAIDAVRQWRYTTPTLNGIPVDVTMTVTVRFTLR